MRLAKERLRWTGHALRSGDKVLSEVLSFIPEGGRRSRGRPRLRFYDTVEANLNARDIIVDVRWQEDFWLIVEARAADREQWRADVVEMNLNH